jgi:hypothetical protein
VPVEAAADDSGALPEPSPAAISGRTVLAAREELFSPDPTPVTPLTVGPSGPVVTGATELDLAAPGPAHSPVPVPPAAVPPAPPRMVPPPPPTRSKWKPGGK